jgi:hypothetical protein
LLSTLGGLTAFGLAGVIIGPVIAAFFLSVWQMAEHEFGPAKAAPPSAAVSDDLELPIPAPEHDDGDDREDRLRDRGGPKDAVGT